MDKDKDEYDLDVLMFNLRRGLYNLEHDPIMVPGCAEILEIYVYYNFMNLLNDYVFRINRAIRKKLEAAIEKNNSLKEQQL